MLCIVPGEDAAKPWPNGDLEAPGVDSAQELAEEYLFGLNGAMSVQEAGNVLGIRWREKPQSSHAATPGAWNQLWTKRNSFYKELEAGEQARQAAVTKLQEMIDAKLAAPVAPGAAEPVSKRKSKECPLKRGRDVMNGCLSNFCLHMQQVRRGDGRQPARKRRRQGAGAQEAAPAGAAPEAAAPPAAAQAAAPATVPADGSSDSDTLSHTSDQPRAS